jgi:hypothetical protein
MYLLPNHTTPMKKNLHLLLLAFLSMQAVVAQSIIAKVTDAENGEGLPYANIDINGENVVSNAEGNFSISEKNSADDLRVNVSFLGYHSSTTTIAEIKANQFIVKLKPGFFELETVNISNVKPNGDSIIAAVKRNLANNYRSAEEPSKSMLFYRESNYFNPVKLNVEITKSTGFSKEALQSTNTQLKAFAANLISHPPKEFRELICNYYTALKTDKGRSWTYGKYDVVKGVKIKDKNRAVSMGEMQEQATEILFKHLDTTKYYRIKSGLFGSRDTIPLGRGAKKNGKEVKESEISAVRSDMYSMEINTNFISGLKYTFVTNPELYDYFYEGTVQSGSQYVYVLKFTPKKSKAKYNGTLYVSDTDYAVVKADYTLADGKTLGGVNLKFLLGVKQSENVGKGTLIFKERAEGGGYYLQYASVTTGEYTYINRPLKFIEITNVEKDVVAFELKVEANTQKKQEYFNMSRSEISQNEFDAVKEKDFKYLQLDSYNPNIWKEYTPIEPLEEMKKFKTIE